MRLCLLIAQSIPHRMNSAWLNIWGVSSVLKGPPVCASVFVSFLSFLSLLSPSCNHFSFLPSLLTLLLRSANGTQWLSRPIWNSTGGSWGWDYADPENSLSIVFLWRFAFAYVLITGTMLNALRMLSHLILTAPKVGTLIPIVQIRHERSPDWPTVTLLIGEAGLQTFSDSRIKLWSNRIT